MPSAAPKDSTTVAIRISGDASARSSSIRISSTTTSVTGMITLESRALAFSMSSRIAGLPADERVGALDRVHRGPDLVDGVEGRRGGRSRPSGWR